MIFRRLRRNSILASAAVTLLIFASGCAHAPRNAKEEAAARRLALNRGITVIIDSSVIHGKTVGNDIFATEENMAIAEALEKHTVDGLRAKGYIVHTPGINSIGTGLPSGKTFDLKKTADEKTADAATGTSGYAPFLITPDTDPAKNLARSIAAKAPLTAADTEGINGEILFVVKAGGRYISGGQMAANVPLGVLNVALIGLMLFGGGGGGSDMPVFLMMDKISLEISVVDKATGEVLITKAFSEDNGSNPDANNFGHYINLALAGLPTADTPISSSK